MNISDFSDILNSTSKFESISLEEMDNVKLMDRMDTKFIFHRHKLNELLQKLQRDYRMLEVNNVRLCKYETLYFDTRDLDLYKMHHNGKLNRYKVRYRTYSDADISFFEVKFKNNKGRTIKDRIKRDGIPEQIEGKAAQFLTEKSPLHPEELIPSVWIYYSRITLVNKTNPERVTIDVGLNCRINENKASIPGFVIAEVKQDKSKNSPAVRALHEMHISNLSISKYCLGVVQLYDTVKKNNFKPRLHRIKKILLCS